MCVVLVAVNNAYYAKVGGVPCNEINSLEVEFLFMVNFTLFVTTDTYSQYYTELCNHAGNTQNVCNCSTGPKVPGLVIPYVNAPGPGQTVSEWHDTQSPNIPYHRQDGEDLLDMSEQDTQQFAMQQQLLHQQQQQQQAAYDQQQLAAHHHQQQQQSQYYSHAQSSGSQSKPVAQQQHYHQQQHQQHYAQQQHHHDQMH